MAPTGKKSFGRRLAPLQLTGGFTSAGSKFGVSVPQSCRLSFASRSFSGSLPQYSLTEIYLLPCMTFENSNMRTSLTAMGDLKNYSFKNVKTISAYI